MGANASYDALLGRIANEKRTHHEYGERIDGHKILFLNNEEDHIRLPMNSNSESPTYLCARHTEDGSIQIATIGIYEKHLCVMQIDLEFDEAMNLIPYSEGAGTHCHRYEYDKDKNKVWRKSHDSKNVFAPDPTLNELLSKIEKFNKSHR